MNTPLYPGHHDNDSPSTNSAKKIAATLTGLPSETRKQTLDALDTEMKLRVIEELYKLGRK